MTEEEWLACGNPLSMLRLLKQAVRAHPRRGRLFAVACCHRVWHLIGDERSRRAVKTAERYAEGLVGEQQLKEVETAAQAASVDAKREKGEVAGNAEWAAFFAASPFPSIAVQACNPAFIAAGDGPKPGPEHIAQCHLLRDIFGNPFRPVALDPAWLTADVRALAKGIYEERAFDRMPILADALQDAGCDNEAVLVHCRNEQQVHVRGCWVIDLLTERK